MIPEFDKFIAIDWSGATGKYDGISVAACRKGRSAPVLVGQRWTRTAIADWLVDQLDGGQRLLIGFDFGFSFPYEANVGYLAGTAPNIRDVFSLWAHIEQKSCEEHDFGCRTFVDDPAHELLFWKSGLMPRKWKDRKRFVETACGAATLYKLIGSKQVGKASITGMRVLHHVRSARRARVSVWPFEALRSSVMAEIYPTLFRREYAGSNAKIRTYEQLNAALEKLGSLTVRKSGNVSDHDSDALISAAGLRAIHRDPTVWAPAESQGAKREGWIFGICRPLPPGEGGRRPREGKISKP